MRTWVLVLTTLLVAGCAQQEAPPPTPPTGPTTTVTVATPSTSPLPTPPTTPVDPSSLRFDGGKAMEHVTMQVTAANGTLRYRIPGTPTNTEVAEEISRVMRTQGYDVEWHHFNATYGCESTPMHNVVATRVGSSGKTVVFAAHYDTRPIADKDPDPSRKAEPVLGANDGASGVAVLLELARVLPPSNDSVQMLFFDGEDGGGTWNGCRTEWILGSAAYAASMTAEQVAGVRALVLVDMIGDHDLVLPKEGYTAADERAAPVQDEIYGVAGELGYDEVFLDRIGPQITDDHVPFLAKKIPAVDLIHLIPGDPRVFPDWHHTTSDTPDAVDPESLEIVGRTLEGWFRSLDA